MATENAFNTIPYSTTRDNRTQGNVLPETIGLDQRSLAMLVVEIRQIAKTIPFAGDAVDRVSSWQEFLDEDPLFFLVAITQVSTQDIRKEINSQTTETGKETLLHLIQIVDRWYRKATQLQIESLVFELENAIENQLKNSIKLLDTISLPPLHKIWHTNPTSNIVSTTIKEQIALFLDTILYLQNSSKTVFESYSKKHEILKPHTALIISFLKLFSHVQKRFNHLTKQHLDYYYETLLGHSKKAAQPERTQVFFKLAKEATSTIIPEKTILYGGMEADGDEILFETLEDVAVSKATIADAITLYVANNSLVSPHNAIRLVTGIYQDQITKTLQLNPNNPAFSLFGKDSFSSKNATTSTQSEIGWAVSGPIFLLKEGIRKVTVDFHIDKESLADFKEQVSLLSSQTNVQTSVWTHRFFSQTFTISFTTDEGWFSPNKSVITITETESAFLLTFSFSLNADDPSICYFDKEIHHGNYNAAWPILQITLDTNNVYYPYSFLRNAKIHNIHTTVTVDELQDVHVCDQFGLLDTSRPFPLFGLQPGKLASCYIGYDEWRYKTLTSVDLEIHWHDVETVNFQNLYKYYPEKVTAQTFQYSICSLSNKKWKQPSDVLENVPLYSQQEARIAPITSIHIDDPATLKMIPDFRKDDFLEFKDAKNGYFQLQITQPSFGFGHGIYENLVNKTVQEITKNPKKARKKNIQIPPLPYVPEAKKIKASYTATQDFILHSNEGRRTDKRFPFEFFHIHPFGLLSRATQEYTKERNLLPFFEDKGYLYLALNQVTPLEKLSIFVKIETQKAGAQTSELATVQWEYLQGEFWKTVPSTFVLHDGTHNFQHSGFIRIQLPKNSTHQHPLFAKEHTWLRLSAANTIADQLGKIICMQLHGVEVRRVMKSSQKAHTTIKKANAIASSYTSIAALQAVMQPFVPTGGVLKETQQDFYTRVSEKLYHKKRGITPSDLEKLILEAFPEVYQASCFPSSLFPDKIAPGVIKIMVLPLIYEGTPAGDRMLSAFHLNKIKKYLSAISTNNKGIEIMNPLYETIRVSCTVNFHDHYEMGLALQRFITTINRFIAPWILVRDKTSNNHKTQSQLLHPSSLLSHLLALPEVEAIGGLSMVQLHESDDGTFIFRETANYTKEGLKPSKPWSVFVPSTAHNINIVNTSVEDTTVSLHIGTMTIEDDFIIQK
ncbi:MAG: hypothetical protein AAF617_04605 [Bacteroidota bacterium]